MSEVINKNKVFSGKFLDFYVDDVINKDGKLIHWEMVSRKGNKRAVMIVAKHIETNQIILTKEFRAPIGDYEIGFPSGLIEDGETVESAIHRELKEETGFDVVKIGEISPFVYNSGGMTDENISIAFVTVKGNFSNRKNESTEEIHPFLIKKEEIDDLINRKDLKFGAKAWIILYMYSKF